VGLTVSGSLLGTNDHFVLDGSAETSATLLGYGGAADDQLIGGGGNDVLQGAAGNDTLTGNGGNDMLDGGAGNDTLNGGGGNDTLTAGTGDDILNGDDGNDRFTLLGNFSAADQIDGGTGNDVLALNGDYSAGVTFTATTMVNVETISLVFGHSYNLTLNDASNTAGLSVDGNPLGSNNHLVLDGSAETSSPLTAYGGAGSDTLIGGAGNDILQGGAGNDTLIGGAGDDTFRGGAGRDVFQYETLADAGTGKDLITDFSVGSSGDVLNVHDLLSGSPGYNGSNAFSGGYLNFGHVGINTIVQVDADGGGNNFHTLVTLQNVTLTAANTDNYVV